MAGSGCAVSLKIWSVSAFAPADAIARHPKKSPVARHARPGALPSLRRSAISAIELVIDLPFLAGEINDAHRQVTFHARGMLLEAKRAGDALLAAKGKVRHGEFKAWVEAHCRCSYRQAANYMQVSKYAPQGTFEGGINAFLESHAKGREAAKSNSTPAFAFDHTDAEWVLKINDRAERGVGAETAVASAKLASIAEGYGMTVDALLERSKAMCPDREKSTQGRRPAMPVWVKLRKLSAALRKP